jgi:uncharacterized protein involved in oxidation of intracellular sulfur
VTILIILNRTPYDGTDVTWNALRLAEQAMKDGNGVRVFLMNDSVDLARKGLGASPDYDLQGMLGQLIAEGAEAKLCKTCVSRCGIGGGETIEEVEVATMPELSEWVSASDRVLTF